MGEAFVRVGEDGRVQEVGQGMPDPGGEEILDFSQYTVMPGFVDAHNHLGMNTGGDLLALATEDDARKHLRAARNARRALAGGVAAMRVCGEKRHMDLGWRQAAQEGLFPSPRLVVAGEMIAPTSGHAAFYARTADGEAAVRRAVRAQAAAGVDFIKIMVSGGLMEGYPGPLDQEFSDDEMAAAIAEAHRCRRKVGGHCFGGRGADTAIALGIDVLEHGTLLTEAQIRAMVGQGTALVVTPAPLDVDAVSGLTETDRELSRRHRAGYARVVAMAWEFGVPLAAGGDFVHGRVDLAYALLLEAGLPPLAALSVLTLGGARLLGLEADTGRVAPGFRADLVVLGSDPLASSGALRDVKALLIGGVPARSEDSAA